VKASHRAENSSPVPGKPTAFDSVPPPPVVSDREAKAAPRSHWRQALLGWAFAPSSRGRFFRLRVSLLLAILSLVALRGGIDWYERRVRTSWHRPLSVALVLVERDVIEPSTLALVHDRARELEQRLAIEYRRHAGREFAPVSFVVTTAVKIDQPPPKMREQTVLGLVSSTYDRWRWTRDIDALAGVDPSAYDARVYLVMKQARQDLAFVEGDSELGGRVAVAQVDIEPAMVDLSLFVVAHELMHTLGASDKYDTEGRAVYPSGFAEPTRFRLYPQPGAEVMARNVPVAARSERPPNTLDELFVGETTAREIGWRSP
jgi:hypothetical protein